MSVRAAVRLRADIQFCAVDETNLCGLFESKGKVLKRTVAIFEQENKN